MWRMKWVGWFCCCGDEGGLMIEVGFIVAVVGYCGKGVLWVDADGRVYEVVFVDEGEGK